MKLWFKYTLSAALGVIMALFLPSYMVLDGILFGIAEFALRAGRFLSFPIVFFTLAVSVCQLRRESRLLKILGRLVLLTVVTAILYTILALAFSFILPVDRIPILSDSSGWKSAIPFRNEETRLLVPELLRHILPINAFNIFQYQGAVILPALLFSFLLGTQLFHDREEAEPVYNLFDSFSRMFYKMNVLFTKILVFTLFSLSFTAVRHILSINDPGSYISVIRLIVPSVLIMVFAIQPLFYFLLSRRNPYKEMKGLLPGIVASLFSGDYLVNYLVNMRVLKENGGMKRKINGLTLPFFTLFSRGGTALITTMAMLTILKSYSSLELTALQIIWVSCISILVSFLLFSQSYLSVYTSLIMACSLYGRGLEDGYVLILPVLPILIPAGALIDAVNAAYLTLLFDDDKEFRIPEDPEDFI